MTYPDSEVVMIHKSVQEWQQCTTERMATMTRWTQVGRVPYQVKFVSTRK